MSAKVSLEHKRAVRRKCNRAYWLRSKENGVWYKQQRVYKLRVRYGITIDEYDQMMMDQAGKCALCGYIPSPRRKLAVDHDHITGQVRGLLCHWCNKYMGWLGDTPDKLRRVLAYQEGGYRAIYLPAN